MVVVVTGCADPSRLQSGATVVVVVVVVGINSADPSIEQSTTLTALPTKLQSFIKIAVPAIEQSSGTIWQQIFLSYNFHLILNRRNCFQQYTS